MTASGAIVSPLPFVCRVWSLPVHQIFCNFTFKQEKFTNFKKQQEVIILASVTRHARTSGFHSMTQYTLRTEPELCGSTFPKCGGIFRGVKALTAAKMKLLLVPSALYALRLLVLKEWFPFFRLVKTEWWLPPGCYSPCIVYFCPCKTTIRALLAWQVFAFCTARSDLFLNWCGNKTKKSSN